MANLRIFILVLALSCSSLTGWAAERFPFLGEVATDKVSVRAGYHVNFERVDILPKGAEVLVLAKEYDWYKIQLPASAKAYVRVDYVKVVNDKIGQINADRLNIRAGRGVNFSPLGQLHKGTYVRLVGKFDDWFQIQPVEGLYGWISKDFLKVKSYTVPTLAQLGLGPVGAESSTVEIEKPESSESAVTGAVKASGVIETVPPDVSMKDVKYQITTDDKTVYYLKIDPAVLKNFAHKAVRLEGEPVPDVSSSLPHTVLTVKKFTLVL